MARLARVTQPDIVESGSEDSVNSDDASGSDELAGSAHDDDGIDDGHEGDDDLIHLGSDLPDIQPEVDDFENELQEACDTTRNRVSINKPSSPLVVRPKQPVQPTVAPTGKLVRPNPTRKAALVPKTTALNALKIRPLGPRQLAKDPFEISSESQPLRVRKREGARPAEFSPRKKRQNRNRNGDVTTATVDMDTQALQQAVNAQFRSEAPQEIDEEAVEAPMRRSLRSQKGTKPQQEEEISHTPATNNVTDPKDDEARQRVEAEPKKRGPPKKSTLPPPAPSRTTSKRRSGHVLVEIATLPQLDSPEDDARAESMKRGRPKKVIPQATNSSDATTGRKPGRPSRNKPDPSRREPHEGVHETGVGIPPETNHSDAPPVDDVMEDSLRGNAQTDRPRDMRAERHEFNRGGPDTAEEPVRPRRAPVIRNSSLFPQDAGTEDNEEANSPSPPKERNRKRVRTSHEHSSQPRTKKTRLNKDYRRDKTARQPTSIPEGQEDNMPLHPQSDEREEEAQPDPESGVSEDDAQPNLESDVSEDEGHDSENDIYRLHGQWTGFQAVCRGLNMIGRNVVDGEQQPKPAVSLRGRRSREIRDAVDGCRAIKRRLREAGLDEELYEDLALDLDAMKSAVIDLVGLENMQVTETGAKRCGQVFCRLIPSIVKLMKAVIEWYEELDTVQQGFDQITEAHLKTVIQLMCLVVDVEHHVSRTFEPPRQPAVRQTLRSYVTRPLADVCQALRVRLLNLRQAVQAKRDMEVEARRRERREAESMREEEEKEQLKKRRKKWGDLHDARMKWTDRSLMGKNLRRFWHPDRIYGLTTSGVVPDRIFFANMPDWIPDEFEALEKGLKYFAGEMVFEEIFKAYCQPRGPLSNRTVTEIVCGAADHKGNLEKDARRKGIAVEDWVKQIPVWKEPDPDSDDDS